MKKLILLLVFIVISCEQKPITYYKQIIETGTLVHVGKEEYIVEWFNSMENYYALKKVDCKSEDCTYYVIPSQIKK